MKRMSEESGYSSTGTSRSKSFEQPCLNRFKDGIKDTADSISLTSGGSSASDVEETSLSLLNSPDSANQRVRPYNIIGRLQILSPYAEKIYFPIYYLSVCSIFLHLFENISNNTLIIYNNITRYRIIHK